MPACPSCGREQTQSGAFCAFCGAVLDRPATAAPTMATAQTAPGKIHSFGDIGFYIVRRLFALLVDLIFVGTLLAVAARTWLEKGSASSHLSVGGFVQLAAVVGAALFAYRWILEGAAGTTIGKLIAGLGVANKRGSSVGPWRALLRNLLLPLDLAFIGFLLASMTPQRQRLGDFIAGTVVANSRIGALAPALGLLMLGGATLATYTYAGGLDAATHLARDAVQIAPSLINGAPPTPQATPSPVTTTGASSTL